MDPWHELTADASHRLPPRVRPWVGLETSMTERIGLAAGAPIAVEVLRQEPGRLHPDERLHFPPTARPATVREVCLSAVGRPLMIARTVFTSYRLRTHPTIARLGTRALGSLLFADGKPTWSAREFALIGPGSPLVRLVRSRHRGVAARVWARRTLFRLFGEPLLVTEIFLPDLIHRPPAPTGLRPVAERIDLPLAPFAPPGERTALR